MPVLYRMFSWSAVAPVPVLPSVRNRFRVPGVSRWYECFSWFMYNSRHIDRLMCALSGFWGGGRWRCHHRQKKYLFRLYLSSNSCKKISGQWLTCVHKMDNDDINMSYIPWIMTIPCGGETLIYASGGFTYVCTLDIMVTLENKKMTTMHSPTGDLPSCHCGWAKKTKPQ